MRRFVLLAVGLFAGIFYSAVLTQQTARNELPKASDYPEAGPACKKKVKMSPWVGVPAVEWPKTYRCVLKYHTCSGVQTVTSDVRPGGSTVCADFWSAHNELASRRICCDGGSRDEKPSSDKEQPAGQSCEPSTDWFDSSSCKTSQGPQLVIDGQTATLYMCGNAVFTYTNPDLRDKLFADAYRAAMRDHLKAAGASKICCDKVNRGGTNRSGCDPKVDIDCDGKPNNEDLSTDGQFPDIDTFVKPDEASVDQFPIDDFTGFDASSPDFLPNRTARNSRGVGACPCKWELVKGELNCSSDRRTRHHYKATWRCPKTGAEVVTFTYAPATSPCSR